ncbi:MAG: hypothetical protein R3B81_14405 [bacterium]
MKRIWTPILAAILAVTAGCNGSSTTGPTGPGPSGGTFTATVDGVDWTASFASAVRQSGVVVLNGSDSAGFSIQVIFSEGSSSPIPIDDTLQANGVVNEGTGYWDTTMPGGIGTVNVTELTTAEVRGTFSFTTGVAGGETPAVREITNGTFDVSF